MAVRTCALYLLSSYLEEAAMLKKQFILLVSLFAGSVSAETIYFCKAYSGGTFYSNTICSQQKAVMDRYFSVPDKMPFDQQVQLAQQQQRQAQSLQPDIAQVAKSDRCAALHRERLVIESRYSNFQWQPLEVINPDQHRMKGLRSEMASLGCPMQ